jgi:hypothetical protein
LLDSLSKQSLVELATQVANLPIFQAFRWLDLSYPEFVQHNFSYLKTKRESILEQQ